MVERCWSLHNHCCCEFIQFYNVHKFSYKFRFLADDGEKLFAIVHVSAKFSNGLICCCNSDPVIEANVFSWHGRVKVGEATSSRYEDIKNTFDQFGLFPSRCGKPYQEYKSDLFGLWLKSKMKILLKQKSCFPTSMQVLFNGSRHSSRAAFLVYEILDKVHYLLQIEFDQQINIYLVGRLFLTDKEDKINLREETPSRTSRIQLSKEMNMILTPLTKEIEEDDASHIYYMITEEAH
ncbi:hypothetical protein RGQ29_013648 [Quercus rubra]|uniref:Uncharacterized protein n=1 Tax=Quercus rubra TaxID=3512 RepID=A0AAN7FK32_QUERU|nr:hypothetical protein RGQ29_013648 [Quercus rubra]